MRAAEFGKRDSAVSFPIEQIGVSPEKGWNPQLLAERELRVAGVDEVRAVQINTVLSFVSGDFACEGSEKITEACQTTFECSEDWAGKSQTKAITLSRAVLRIVL